VGKLIHASNASDYNSNELGSSHTTVESKNRYLKTFKVSDLKSTFKSRYFFCVVVL
jgi:hypothetical protein